MSEANINKISIKEFMAACHDGNLNIVKQYVEQGGDIHVRTSNGNDGFSRAIYKGHIEVAKYLLENGADINAQSEKGKTPLHRVIFRGKLDSIKFLIEKGANLDIQDQEGNTPLHYTAKFNYNKVAKLLVDKGARLDIMNFNGHTALEETSLFTSSLEKVWTKVRNIYEGNNKELYSDDDGSVQEIIEAKLLEQVAQLKEDLDSTKEVVNKNQEVNNDQNLKKLSIATKLKQFAEEFDEAISHEMPGSQMHKALISLKDAVEYAIKDAQEGRLDRAEAILKALVDASEGKVYTAEVEAVNIADDSPSFSPEEALNAGEPFSADDQGLAGKSPVTNEDIHPEPTDSNSATIIDNNQ